MQDDIFLDLHFDPPLEVSVSGPTYRRMLHPNEDDCSLVGSLHSTHILLSDSMLASRHQFWLRQQPL